MIFYAPKNTGRIRYILDHIFLRILKIEYEFTEDESLFIHSHHKIKISYGKSFAFDEIYLPKTNDILFENTINFKSFEEVLQQKKDLLALSFLLLTRYQEYLPFEKDRHGRFPYEADLIFQSFPIEKPLVDEFAFYLKEQIQKKNSSFKFPTLHPGKLISIDVDRVWNFRTTSPLLLLLKGLKYKILRQKENSQLLRYFVSTQNDPYDSFQYIEKKCLQSAVSSIYFVLMSRTKSKFDKNIKPSHPLQKNYLAEFGKSHSIGIHPSYRSHSQLHYIKEEKEVLESLIGKAVKQSRQHYIRMQFPKTYNSLLQAGIGEDYSMGFPEKNGFRAGTSHPFLWFNLERNETATLKVFPFCLMDITLQKKENHDVPSAISLVQQMKNEVYEKGGVFIPIFHNHYFHNQGNWKNWQKVFEECLK